MTHTPGPIRVREQNELDKTLKCVRLEDDNGVFVLVVDEKYGDLIAAAPDMLKMLLELQECAEYWSEYNVPLGIVGRLNETIRKARGEV